jgi:hypothetical protein
LQLEIIKCFGDAQKSIAIFGEIGCFGRIWVEAFGKEMAGVGQIIT